MTLRTRLCEQFGIEHPILNAPMGGGDAPATLAAAVANAGGLGMIGGTTVGGVPWLVEQIRGARELTDRNFGVGIMPSLRRARRPEATPDGSPRCRSCPRSSTPSRRCR